MKKPEKKEEGKSDIKERRAAKERADGGGEARGLRYVRSDKETQ